MTFPLSDFHFVSDTVRSFKDHGTWHFTLTLFNNSYGCHIFHERYDQQLWSINFRVINVCVCVVTKLVYFCNEYLADVSSNAKHCECIQYCLSNIKFLFWQKSILPKICVNLVLFPAIYQAEAALGGKVAILSFVGVTLPSSCHSATCINHISASSDLFPILGDLALPLPHPFTPIETIFFSPLSDGERTSEYTARFSIFGYWQSFGKH